MSRHGILTTYNPHISLFRIKMLNTHCFQLTRLKFLVHTTPHFFRKWQTQFRNQKFIQKLKPNTKDDWNNSNEIFKPQGLLLWRSHRQKLTSKIFLQHVKVPKKVRNFKKKFWQKNFKNWFASSPLMYNYVWYS